MCFALVPKAEYKSEFEGKSIRAIQHKIPTLIDADTELLIALQYIHDHESVARWPEKLYFLFLKYKLQWPSSLPIPNITPQPRIFDDESDEAYSEIAPFHLLQAG